MATLQIAGKDVEVDDSFLKLSPDEQQNTVNDIARQIGAGPSGTTGPAQPAQPQMSAWEAGGRGLTNLFGFEPKVEGIQAAGRYAGPGAAPVPHESELSDFVRGMYRYWANNPEAVAAYTQRAQEERARNEAAWQQQPIAYGAGQFGGALLTAPLEPAAAANWGARALQAARTGAIYGGLTGLGEAQGGLGDYARQVGGGAFFGGLGGGALSPLGELALQAGSKATQPIRDYFRPQQAAERMVTGAVERGIAATPAAERLTTAELGTTPEAMLADLGGEPTRTLLRRATDISPEARGLAERQINDRFGGQAPRTMDVLNQMAHYPNADAQAAAIDQVERTTNRVNYQRAYNEGDRQIMTPEMERLLGSPAVVEAMRRANTSGQDRAIAMGMGAFRPGATVENGIVRFNRGPTGVPTYPNLQYWDAVKKELDNMTSQAGRSGDTNSGVYNGLSQTLRNELDSQVPSYARARQGAAGFFGQENMLDAGRAFLSDRNPNYHATEQLLARVSPTERRLFEDGFMSDYIQGISRFGDRTNILNRINNNEDARRKFNLVMGPQRANELEAHLRIENIMDRLRGAMGNSATVRLALAGATFGGAANLYEGENPFSLSNIGIGTLAGAGIAHGKKQIAADVMRRVGTLLMSRDVGALNRGRQLIAKSDSAMNALRRIDNLTSRAAGTGAANLMGQ